VDFYKRNGKGIPNHMAITRPIPIGTNAQIKGIGSPGIALLGYLETIWVFMRQPIIIAMKVTPMAKRPRYRRA
jgi:hypothetical protein